jgi:hypothetical protein
MLLHKPTAMFSADIAQKLRGRVELARKAAVAAVASDGVTVLRPPASLPCHRACHRIILVRWCLVDPLPLCVGLS